MSFIAYGGLCEERHPLCCQLECGVPFVFQPEQDDVDTRSLITLSGDSTLAPLRSYAVTQFAGKVNLHLEQTGFSSAQARGGAKGGWKSMVGKLEKLLEQ